MGEIARRSDFLMESYFLAPTPYAHSGEMLLVVINIFLLFVQEETEMETFFDSKVRKSTYLALIYLILIV